MTRLKNKTTFTWLNMDQKCTYIHTLYDNVNICTFCIVFPVTETTAAAATAAPTALLSSALCNVNPQRPVF